MRPGRILETSGYVSVGLKIIKRRSRANQKNWAKVTGQSKRMDENRWFQAAQLILIPKSLLAGTKGEDKITIKSVTGYILNEGDQTHA